MTKSKTPMTGKVQKPNGIRCVQCSLNTSSINWLFIINSLQKQYSIHLLGALIYGSSQHQLEVSTAGCPLLIIPTCFYSSVREVISLSIRRRGFLHTYRVNVATIFPDADFDWLGGRSKRPQGHESQCFHHRPPSLTLPAQQTRRRKSLYMKEYRVLKILISRLNCTQSTSLTQNKWRQPSRKVSLAV